MPSKDQNQEPDPGAPKSRTVDPGLTGGCGACGDSCACGPESDDADTPSGPFRGWSLALIAAAYFLVPLGCALAGATAFRADTDTQALATVVSLALGMVITAAAARSLGRRQSKETLHG